MTAKLICELQEFCRCRTEQVQGGLRFAKRSQGNGVVPPLIGGRKFGGTFGDIERDGAGSAKKLILEVGRKLQ